jgi:hypothetical protein
VIKQSLMSTHFLQRYESREDYCCWFWHCPTERSGAGNRERINVQGRLLLLVSALSHCHLQTNQHSPCIPLCFCHISVFQYYFFKFVLHQKIFCHLLSFAHHDQLSA